MTSIELFRLLKFKKKALFHIYFYTFVFLKYIMGEELHHFMKKIQIFCIRLWYNNWCQNKIMQEKTVEKKKWAGLNNLICINFKCL